MSLSQETRRLAFQVLFLLEANGGGDASDLVAGIEEAHPAKERAKAAALASRAYEQRSEADAAMLELAPTWPAHRQPAVDRAILRLAYHEIVSDAERGAIYVNEAVELAKQFGTDKSPGFVNALLDRVLKKAQGKPTPAADLPLPE
jgi:N utilization substance protein B